MMNQNQQAATSKQKQKHQVQRAREGLLIYSMPFWYGAITRLPFIYFVIHMRFHFNLDWTSIGFFVGSYQACRVVTGIATVLLPARVAHLVCTVIALAGNLLVLVSDNNDKVPFLVGTIVIGFAETLACMQTYVKEYYLESDLAVLGQKLKVQYAAVCIGVTLAFAVGGVVYEFAGINGIACFGTVAALMELISLITYIAIERMSDSDYYLDYSSSATSISESISDADLVPRIRTSVDSPPPSEVEEEDPRALALPVTPFQPRDGDRNRLIAYASDDEMSDCDVSECDVLDSQLGATYPASPATGDETTKEKGEADEENQSPPPRRMTEEDLNDMVDYFSKSGASPNYITYILCFTFGMEAVTIGYNLAVSPIYITEQFGKSTAVIGIMLAAGAAFGTMVSIFMTLSKRGKNFLNRLLPDPLGFLVGMSGITLAVLFAALPSFPIHLIGLLLLMGFNDYAAIVLNEMQGSVTSAKAYRTIAPKGQIVRRCGNVITAITGPILFGYLPTLPYIVAGAVTASWTLILIIVIRRRMKVNTETILHIKEKEGLSASEDEVKQMTFARQEVLARLMKRRFAGKDEALPRKRDSNLTHRSDLSDGEDYEA